MPNPSFASSTAPAPDKLIAGEFPRVMKTATLKSGENRTRGAVLGEVLTIAAAVAGANTGNGVFGAITGGIRLKAGIYTVLCIAAAANAGTFILTSPNGDRVGKDITVAVAFVSDHMNFTIADGAADFIVGDKFTITVSRSGKFILSAAAAVDGSNIPSAILVEDCDATAADKDCSIYESGEFDEATVVLGAGHTLATVRPDLKAQNIYLRTTTAA